MARRSAAALGITGELRDRLMTADRLELRRALDPATSGQSSGALEGVLWVASDVLDRLDRELNPVLRSGCAEASWWWSMSSREQRSRRDGRAAERGVALLKRVFDR